MYRSYSLPARRLSLTSLLSLCLALACYTPREVGDSRDMDSLQIRGVGGDPIPSGGGAYGVGSGPQGSAGQGEYWGAGGSSYSGCEPSEARASYEAWRGAANDFGEFAGTSWLVQDTPTMLVIGYDVAYVQYGDYVAPVSGQGYLEPQEPMSTYGTAFPWVEGGRYELHGVTLGGNGVYQGELPTAAAHSDWCSMQIPYPAADGTHCVFDSYASPARLSECTAGGEPVDCWWLRVNQSGVCACDFQGCFPNVRREYSVYELQINFVSATEAVMLLVGPKQEPGDPTPDPLPMDVAIQYRLVRH